MLSMIDYRRTLPEYQEATMTLYPVSHSAGGRCPKAKSSLLAAALLLTALALLATPNAAFCDPQSDKEFAQACTEIKQHDCRCAKDRLLKLANQGHAKAQTLLGLLYEEGVGVDKDLNQARLWYMKAARKGLREAESRLGRLYLSEKAEFMKDKEKAEKWLTRAAEHGEVEAQTKLGTLLMSEVGLEGIEMHGLMVSGPKLKRKHDDAVRWLHLAADRGSDEARKSLEGMPGGVELEDAVAKGKDRLTQSGRATAQGMSNIETSWEGYADLVQSVRQVGSAAASAN